ncbi:hypothetical protein [Microseira sp. BLCC-F43]|uniref:hypothetical protein n=1 Tax=Microseira sp. BLCC-F43 TaxID=3153602 RepID=UPI0035B939BA
MVTCRSYNLNGDPKSALAALAYLGIAVKRFVSKNVCYGICYDWEMHGQLAAVKDKSLSLSLIWQGIDIYLRVRPHGKVFHDPLAACCAIDQSIATRVSGVLNSLQGRELG